MKRICLGKISAAHGVKGFVKIIPYGDDIGLLEGTLFIGETGEETIEITLKNPMGKFILAGIDGCHSRENAESIKGTELWIDRDALPDLDEGEFYIEDLIGLEAVNENGDIIGKVVDAPNYGAGDLLEVKPKAGQTFLIPFTDDTIGTIEETITLKNYEVYLLS